MKVARTRVRTPRGASVREKIPRTKTEELYVGVIIVAKSNPGNEFNLLESLGIAPGRYNKAARGYLSAEVPAVALEKLDMYWGKFIWSLHSV